MDPMRVRDDSGRHVVDGSADGLIPGVVYSHDVFEMDLRLACELEGSQARFAYAHDMTPPFVSLVLNRRARPGERLCRILGWRRVWTGYRDGVPVPEEEARDMARRVPYDDRRRCERFIAGEEPSKGDLRRVGLVPVAGYVRIR